MTVTDSAPLPGTPGPGEPLSRRHPPGAIRPDPLPASAPDAAVQDRPVQTADLLALVAAGELAPDRLDAALAATGLVPDSGNAWQRRFARLLPALAVLFATAAVICLVAANWQAWGPMVKFGAGLVLLVGVVVTALWLGLDGLRRPAGRWLLVLAIGLIGPLLALYGQTYQTGADIHKLMFVWAALALPWMVAARLATAWMLVLAILEGACLFWLSAVDGWLRLPRPVPLPTWFVAGLLQAVLLVGWEVAARRLSWLQSRWPQRTIALALLLVLTAAASLAVVHEALPWRGPALIVWGASLAVLGAVYGRRAGPAHGPDLAILSFGLLSLTAVVAALTAEATRSTFATALAVLTVVAIGALGLRSWQLSAVAAQGSIVLTRSAIGPPASAASTAAARSLTRGEAATTLRRRDVVPAGASLARLTDPGEVPVSLALQASIAFGAWVSSLMVLTVIGPILFVSDTEALPAGVGAALCLLSAVVNRLRDHRREPGAVDLFRDHLMLAIGLCGMGLLIRALFDWMGEPRSGPVWLGLATALVLVIANPEAMHRFMTSLVAIVLAGYLVVSHGGPHLVAPWLLALVLAGWLGQGYWSRLGWDGALLPVATAATLSLLIVMGIGTESKHVGVEGWIVDSPALSGALVVGVLITAWCFGRREASGSEGRVGRVDPVVLIAALLAVGWCLASAPVTAGCLLIWAVALGTGHRRIAGLALAAIAVHLAVHYYGLETTLASKGLRLMEMAAAASLVPLASAWRQRIFRAVGGAR